MDDHEATSVTSELFFSEEEVARIDQVVMGSLRDYQNRPIDASISILHRTHGVVLQRNYGKMNPEQPFWIASLSKVFVAGILLRLEEESALNLNEPIQGFGFSGADDVGGVTPAQLLSNLSGMKCPRNRPGVPYWRCQFDFSSDLETCARELWDWHVQNQTLDPVDSELCYGGAQWQVAGAVAQRASGESWENLFNRIYVDKCGLRNSGFSNQFGPGRVAPGVWSGYPSDIDPGTSSGENPNIEGGMYSTVSDLSELLLMFLRDGRCRGHQVLAPDSVNKSKGDRILATAAGQIRTGFLEADLEAFGRGYGLGWWVKRSTGQRIVPGAYGSTAWISADGEYAVLAALKTNGSDGRRLFEALEPEVASMMRLGE